MTWQVKDVADGWIDVADEASAKRLSEEHSGAAIRFVGSSAWPEITDAWVDTYCELTGRDPEGLSVSFIGDGPVSNSFRDIARREIDAMLCAAPKAAVAIAKATGETA
jgi:hypothetical protein